MITQNSELNFQECLHVLPADKFDFAEINKIITKCSYCGEYKQEDNTWNPISPIIPTEGIEGNISHGICPKCFEEVLKAI